MEVLQLLVMFIGKQHIKKLLYDIVFCNPTLQLQCLFMILRHCGCGVIQKNTDTNNIQVGQIVSVQILSVSALGSANKMDGLRT